MGIIRFIQFSGNSGARDNARNEHRNWKFLRRTSVGMSAGVSQDESGMRLYTELLGKVNQASYIYLTVAGADFKRNSS